MIITYYPDWTYFHDLSIFDCYDPSLIHWTCRNRKKRYTYCWWTKSCTTKDDDYPIIYRILYIPGGCLGFLPSTVGVWMGYSRRPYNKFVWKEGILPNHPNCCSSAGARATCIGVALIGQNMRVKTAFLENLDGDSQTLGVIRWSLVSENARIWTMGSLGSHGGHSDTWGLTDPTVKI